MEWVENTLFNSLGCRLAVLVVGLLLAPLIISLIVGDRLMDLDSKLWNKFAEKVGAKSQKRESLSAKTRSRFPKPYAIASE